MLPVKIEGTSGPLVIMLHWLGGSAKTWTEVMSYCSARGLRCAAFDLPGFGHAIDGDDFTVTATVDMLIASMQLLRGNFRGPWFLAGHSMGGKFAAIIARLALDGYSGLEGLSGLILISPSPPGPEPMDESVRDKNIESLGGSTLDSIQDRAHAEEFVDANIGKLKLPNAIRYRTVGDLLRMNRSALVSWLIEGSREDWALRVDRIPLPALVLAGTAESALGPEAQCVHVMPHFTQATLVALEGAGHLSPLECPAELADRIAAFIGGLGHLLEMPAAQLAIADHILIDSDLTSPQSRAVLKKRIADDLSPEPTVLSLHELLTLRAISARVIPGCPFDLSMRVHRWLADGVHDGWRHNSLPADVEAWRTGLRFLDVASIRRHGVPFSALDAPRQDECLILARDGRLGKNILDTLHFTEDPVPFTAAQMSDWFSDLHSELTRLYVADPRTMHRIGFTGFADQAGFTRIRLNEVEPFEREEFEQ